MHASSAEEADVVTLLPPGTVVWSPGAVKDWRPRAAAVWRLFAVAAAAHAFALMMAIGSLGVPWYSSTYTTTWYNQTGTPNTGTSTLSIGVLTVRRPREGGEGGVVGVTPAGE